MKNLFKALANFQQEVPVILKDVSGYGYVYADLPAILTTINPLLKKHGLGFTQLIIGTSLKTIVFHIESGESIEGVSDIPQGVTLAKMNEFQVMGSAITYFRRYTLSSMLGLVTDKDTDAGGEQTKKEPVKQPLPVKPPLNVTKEDLNEQLHKVAINKCNTLEELKTLYTNNPSMAKNPNVVAAKDKRKAELTKV